MSCFYVAAMSETPDGGIYRYEMKENAAPQQAGFTALNRVTYLAWGPGRTTMYATCSLAPETGGVAAFKVAADGSLSLLNTFPANGKATCYLCVSANGKFLYAVNYSTSTFCEYQLNPDGSIAKMVQQLRHEGKTGPNLKRQECPHPHYCNFTPDGKYLFVIDLGLDAIKAYPFDPEKGIDPSGVKTSVITPAGDGPRHIVFDRSGKIAYVLMELASAVHSVRYEDGIFTTIERKSTLPRLCNCSATKAAAIRLSPDGKYLFASNRGYDYIAVYRLDGKGAMTLTDMVASYGSSPRDIDFLPGGKMFAAANEFTDNVVYFDYDDAAGKLTPNGLVHTLVHPLHVFR